MWQLKRLLDPRGILNPGVVLSDDPQSHLKNLASRCRLPTRSSTSASSAVSRTGLPVARTDPNATPAHRPVARHPGEEARRRRHHGAGARLPLPGHRHLRRHRPMRPALSCEHQHRRADPQAARRRRPPRRRRHLAGAQLCRSHACCALRPARCRRRPAPACAPCWPGPAAASARPAAAACRNGRRRCRSRYAWRRRPPARRRAAEGGLSRRLRLACHGPGLRRRRARAAAGQDPPSTGKGRLPGGVPG